MLAIDLNSDLGESFGAWKMGDDAAMLDVVSSANVACGFHAGDPAGILKTLRAAAERGVAVGAHVGYRDLAGFGRRNMDPTSEELISNVDLPDRCAEGPRCSSRHARHLCEAARRTLQHDRARCAPGSRCDRCDPRSRS